jgi:SAM-dependent methyltransferase
VVDDLRVRHRQGRFLVVDGVPTPDLSSSWAVLPHVLTGRWLGSQTSVLRGALLDLGAGNQPFRAWYEPHVESVVAVDATPTIGIGALAFATQLPFGDETFDTVLCTMVLEHVDDVERAMAEVARVLRPGGRLLVSVPFLYPTHEAPYDFWRATHLGLRSLLERHGFDVGDLVSQGGPGVLIAHYLAGGAAQVLARLTGRFGRLANNRVLRTVFVMPQMWFGRRVSQTLSGTSRVVSLGYMASARKAG